MDLSCNWQLDRVISLTRHSHRSSTRDWSQAEEIYAKSLAAAARPAKSTDPATYHIPGAKALGRSGGGPSAVEGGTIAAPTSSRLQSARDGGALAPTTLVSSAAAAANNRLPSTEGATVTEQQPHPLANAGIVEGAAASAAAAATLPSKALDDHQRLEQLAAGAGAAAVPKTPVSAAALPLGDGSLTTRAGAVATPSDSLQQLSQPVAVSPLTPRSPLHGQSTGAAPGTVGAEATAAAAAAVAAPDSTAAVPAAPGGIEGAAARGAGSKQQVPGFGPDAALSFGSTDVASLVPKPSGTIATVAAAAEPTTGALSVAIASKAEEQPAAVAAAAAAAAAAALSSPTATAPKKPAAAATAAAVARATSGGGLHASPSALFAPAPAPATPPIPPARAPTRSTLLRHVPTTIEWDDDPLPAASAAAAAAPGARERGTSGGAVVAGGKGAGAAPQGAVRPASLSEAGPSGNGATAPTLERKPGTSAATGAAESPPSDTQQPSALVTDRRASAPVSAAPSPERQQSRRQKAAAAEPSSAGAAACGAAAANATAPEAESAAAAAAAALAESGGDVTDGGQEDRTAGNSSGAAASSPASASSSASSPKRGKPSSTNTTGAASAAGGTPAEAAAVSPARPEGGDGGAAPVAFSPAPGTTRSQQGAPSLTPGPSAPSGIGLAVAASGLPRLGSSGGSGSPSVNKGPLYPPPSLRVVTVAPQGSGSTHTVTMVPYRDGLRVSDVIEFVARRHRLPVFYERFVLRVGREDASRLNLSSGRDLAPGTLMAPLGLDTVELVKKTFADSPPDARLRDREAGGTRGTLGGGVGSSIDATGTGTTGRVLPQGPGRPSIALGPGSSLGDAASSPALGAVGSAAAGSKAGGGAGTPTGGTASPNSQAPWSGAVLHGGRSGAPGLGNVAPLPGGLHNAISAAAFQEWCVIKINKRGRRQERLMGIDLTRITNRKLEKSRIFFSDSTRNAERLISDIRRVEIPESDRCRYTIEFRDPAPPPAAVPAGGPSGGAVTPSSRHAPPDAPGADGSSTTLTYETHSAAEREEIIAKLVYIMRMSGTLQKIARVP